MALNIVDVVTDVTIQACSQVTKEGWLTLYGSVGSQSVIEKKQLQSELFLPITLVLFSLDTLASCTFKSLLNDSSHIGLKKRH